jgi:hypothetical protein
MSLLARLENLAAQLPESHFPAPGAIGRLVGALVLFAEHGEEILDAAEHAGPDAEQTLHTFLTTLAEQENERVAQAGGQPPQPQVPPGPVQVQSAPVPIPQAPPAVPAQPAPTPATPQTEQPSVAELVAQLQAAQALIADLQRERGTVTSSPAEPTTAGTGETPAGDPPSDSTPPAGAPETPGPASPGAGFVPPSTSAPGAGGEQA